MNATSHATGLIIGAVLCVPVVALAHGQAARGTAVPGHAAPSRPFTLRTGVSVPLGPRVRGPESAPRNGEGSPGGRLLEGSSNPGSSEMTPAPAPTSDFDPLRRRRLALPAAAARAEL